MMRLLLADRETTAPGLILSLICTGLLWVFLFTAGWNFGLYVTGSEIGAAVGAAIPGIYRKIPIRLWTI